METSYNMMVWAALAILLAMMLGIFVAGVWRNLTRQMTRCGLAVFLIAAAIATVEAQKSTNTPPRSLSAPAPTPPVATVTLDGTNDIQDVTRPLVITSIGLDTNGIFGTFSWLGRNDGGSDAATIDLLAAWPTLTNVWRWIGSLDLQGAVVSQEWGVAFSELGLASRPNGMFLAMKDRQTAASTMDDWDGDGIPDLYEVKNGTNPYVPDYAYAPKLTVGNDGEYTTLSRALAASTNYSIVEVTGVQNLGRGMFDLPAHPVMITGPIGEYALITSEASPYAIGLTKGQDNQTIVQNIYLDMLPSSAGAMDSYQVGFWCGKNLTGGGGEQSPPASGTFRNIYIRASRTYKRGMGWVFSGWMDSPALIEHCVVNAFGSKDFAGIEQGCAPALRVENCTFMNFPSNGVGVSINDTHHHEYTSKVEIVQCVFDESFTNAYPFAVVEIGPSIAIANSILPENCCYTNVAKREDGIVIGNNNVSWFGYAVAGGAADSMGIGALASIDETSTMDSDGDGLTDWDEVYVYSTDPFKQDTDGDKIPDGVEIGYGTNPRLPTDYAVALTVNCPNAFLTNALTWVVIDDGVHEPVAVTAACQTVEWIVRSFSDGSLPKLSLSNDQCRVVCQCERNGAAVSFEESIDRDYDGIDDIWELFAGLCPTNKTDAIQDNDNDGLINLHEYWAGTNPLLPDGSNTLLSVLARSIDNRLVSGDAESALRLFSNWEANSMPGTFSRNTNAWTRGIDLSCMSVCNTNWFNQKAPVAISPLHVIMARHWAVPCGHAIFFIGNDDKWYTNKIKSVYTISTPTISAQDLDVQIGLLDSPLPAAVPAAMIFPSDVTNKIGSGAYLPVIQINQDKNALVNEIESIYPSANLHLKYQDAKILKRVEYSQRVRSGDSGSPSFAVCGEQVVLLGMHHSYYIDPSCMSCSNLIQHAMDILLPSNPYKLQALNLSDYPDIR